MGLWCRRMCNFRSDLLYSLLDRSSRRHSAASRANWTCVWVSGELCSAAKSLSTWPMPPSDTMARVVASAVRSHWMRVRAKMGAAQSFGFLGVGSSSALPALSTAALAEPSVLAASMPRSRASLELRRSSFLGSIWSSLLSCSSFSGLLSLRTSNWTPMVYR